MKVKPLDIIFIAAFLFSLAALSMTHYALAHGAIEIAPITSIAIYHYALGMNWIFAAQWTFFTFIYYLFRGGKLLKTKGDTVLATVYPFMLLNFCFIDMWNDVLILAYMFS